MTRFPNSEQVKKKEEIKETSAKLAQRVEQRHEKEVIDLTNKIAELEKLYKNNSNAEELNIAKQELNQAMDRYTKAALRTVTRK